MYHGDHALESTFDIKFTSRKFSTGAPFALAGTPVISAYPGNSTTQITAGITLTTDFDTVTGLNNVRVVATAANGYATATNYALVITTGTVDSVSVVGEVVGHFSLEARSALRPTVAARTLDVSATGEAGIDWANIGSPTTANNLSATNIDVDQVVASVSGAVGSVTGAVGSVTAGVTLAASAVQAVWDAATAALTTVGSIGKLLVDNINATISSRMATYTQPTGFLAATFPAGTVANTTNITAATGIVLSGVTHTGAVIPTVSAVTGLTAANLDAAISTRATPAQVNTEVVDALAVDNYGEPGQNTPPATNTLAAKINYLYKLYLNKKEQTASTFSLYNNAGTIVDQKATLSDDGTTFANGNIVSGP